MGIIQKQAVRNTVIQVAGNMFGAVTRLLMPLVLSAAEIGVFQILDAISGFFKMVFNLGFTQVLSRLFPKYRDEENGHHGFLAFGIYISLIGIVFSYILYFILGTEFWVNVNDENYLLVQSFVWLVIPRIFFRILFVNVDGYVKMLFNSVIGSFLESLVIKIVIATGVLLFWLTYIEYSAVVYFYMLAFCIPGVVIIIYALAKTKKITAPAPELYAKENRKQLSSLMLFGMLAGASGSLVLYVDTYMVTNLISVEAIGIYGTLFFAARLIIMPSRAINAIANTVLAESWKENDMDNILLVYRKSCLNQLLLGGFLYVLGWGLIESALSFSEKFNEYSDHIYVFFFLGLSVIIEMATGTNSAVISTSKKYRYNTYFILILVAVLITTNFIFIKYFSLEGAAMASAVSVLIVNLIRWAFLYKTYNLQPFNWAFFKTLFFVAGMMCVAQFLNVSDNQLINLLSKGVILTALFWGGAILLKLSPDINEWLTKIKNIILRK